AGGCVPKQHRASSFRGGEDFAVRRKRDMANLRCLLTSANMKLPSGSGCPQTDRGVFSGRGDRFSIRLEGNRADLSLVPEIAVDLLAGSHVPETHDGIFATRCDRFAVRGESNGSERPRSGAAAVNGFARDRIPKPQRAIASS